MARRSTQRFIEQSTEINLIPIMSIVMIIIPLVLVTATFVDVNAVATSSPRTRQVMPSEPAPDDDSPLPLLLVAIAPDGFTVTDLRQTPAFAESGLGRPLPECQGRAPADPRRTPVTLCTPADRLRQEDMLSRLDFRGLYNRLVEIKNYAAWQAQWTSDDAIINIVAQCDVPYEVVVRTMDVAQYLLESDAYESDEAFRAAAYRTAGGERRPVGLFPTPILLAPCLRAMD